MMPNPRIGCDITHFFAVSPAFHLPVSRVILPNGTQEIVL
jgi:hypothetical protein